MSNKDKKNRLGFFKAMQLLNSFMKGQRIKYFFSILAIGCGTLLALISPLIIRISIDSIIGNKPVSDIALWLEPYFQMVGGRTVLSQNLWMVGIVILLLSSANGLFLFAKGKLSAEASESIARKIKEKLYNHIQRLSYNYHVKSETGDLIQRCTSDVETIRKFLAMQMVEIGRALFMVILVIPLMLNLNVKMTLISMFAVPFVFLFSFIFFIKIQNVFQVSDEAEGKLSNVLQENISGVRVVRAFAGESYEINKFEEVNKDYRDKNYKLIRVLAWYWSLSDFLCLLQIGSVVIVGTYYTVAGIITLGTLIVFNTYVGMLLWPVRQLGRILTDLGKMIVSLSRVNEILNEKEEPMAEIGETPKIKGSIEFKNVSFEYEKDKSVLKDLSFKINSGKTVAILGKTGSGKSSLIHLLLRLYEPTNGEILIDGVKLTKIAKNHLRSKISIVLQEPFLYSRTIKKNIALGNKIAADNEIFESAKCASVHNVIQEFEKGYDTEVGENGVTLSGGQKQRIAIARSIVRNTPVMIFDDSLSAVDTETDSIIRERLAQKSGKSTNIIISHRIATVINADLILVLKNGTLSEMGTHQELIKSNGFYKHLWSIQNELEDEFGTEFTSDEYENLHEDLELVEV